MTSIRVVYFAEPNFPATDQHPDAVRYFVGGKWVDAIDGEPTEADLSAFLNPPKIITVVTMRQARLALLAVGKLAAVESAIQQAGDAAKIEWEYAQELRRDHPLVSAMGSALGLSAAELDQLFVQAATL